MTDTASALPIDASTSIDMLEEIRRLCELPPRLAGSEGERLAHDRVATVLMNLGLEPEVEEFSCPASLYGGLAAHAGLLAGAGLAGLVAPPVGAVLAGLVTASLHRDLSGRGFWVRRLFPQLASRNVLARIAPTGPVKRRVVIMAHVDAARQGPALLFEPSRARRTSRKFREWFGGSPSPTAAMVWVGAAQTALLAGASIKLVNRLATLPLIGLQAFVATAMGKAALGPVVPGASDDASGVAVMLKLAEDLVKDRLDSTEVWVVATGCEEPHLGGAFHHVQRRASEHDPETTAFVALDTVGAGRVRYCTTEGLASKVSHDPGLVGCCDDLTRDDDDEQAPRPFAMGFATDALAPALRGYRTLSLIALDEDDYPPNYHWPTDTPDAIDPRTLASAHRLMLRLLRRVDVQGFTARR